MKRNTWIAVIAAFALLLSACGTRTSSTNRFRTGSFTLTPETKLALGTLKLDETPQAVDATMASKLLPLWQLLSQLNSSNTAAPQEVQAVVDQIRSTMNPSQVQSIDGMKLSSADMQTLFQGQGQTSRTGGTAGANGSSSRTGSSTGSRGNGGGQAFFFAGGGGGVPGGGGFPGGGGVGNAGRTANSATATQTANGTTQQSRSATTAVTGFLINRVIQLLESKVQA